MPASPASKARLSKGRIEKLAKSYGLNGQLPQCRRSQNATIGGLIWTFVGLPRVYSWKLRAVPNDTCNVPNTTGRTSIVYRQVVFVKSRWSVSLLKLSTLPKCPTDPRCLSHHGVCQAARTDWGKARRGERHCAEQRRDRLLMLWQVVHD